MHGGLSLSSTSFQPRDGIAMGARLTLHKGVDPSFGVWQFGHSFDSLISAHSCHVLEKFDIK